MGVTLDDLYAEALRNFLYQDTESFTFFSLVDRQEIIKSVLKVYSKRRPLLQLEVYTATSVDYYTLPASWEDGFSSIKEIEYPIENTPPDVIEAKDYKVSLMSDGKKLRFIRNNPASGTFWVKYSIRHTFDSNGDSEIPVVDQTALGYLACSHWCEAIATFYASRSNPNLSEAEVIEYTSRTAEYNGKAQRWMDRYTNELKDDFTGLHGGVGFIQDPYFDRDDD